MIRRKLEGKEGAIKSYAFRFLGKSWIVAKSKTKWHSGEKYKRAPIWISSIKSGIPALFIWNVAIGFDNRRNTIVEDAESDNLEKNQEDTNIRGKRKGV